MNNCRIALLIASIVLFAISLFLPTVYLEADHDTSGGLGWHMLAAGWMAPLGGWLVVEWWANPLLLVAWVAVNRRNSKVAFGCAAAALCLSLAFLLRSKFMVSTKPDWIDISGYDFGYWLWVLSAATAFASASALYFAESKKTNLTATS